MTPEQSAFARAWNEVNPFNRTQEEYDRLQRQFGLIQPNIRITEATPIASAQLGGRRQLARVQTYLIESPKSGAVKIGISAAPETRLQQMQTGNADTLILIGTFDGNLETKLHKQFAEYRVGGEWFRSEPVLRWWANLDNPDPDGRIAEKKEREEEANRLRVERYREKKKERDRRYYENRKQRNPESVSRQLTPEEEEEFLWRTSQPPEVARRFPWGSQQAKDAMARDKQARDKQARDKQARDKQERRKQ